MDIRPFGVEIWMNEFETKCELNLAETCVESITLGELFDMAGLRDRILDDLSAMKMTYGAIEGSDRLRDAIADLYARQTRDNILTTHGTIGANSLVHQALVSRGDHVISVIPTYQQHYSIPESLGADVELLHLRPENGFLPDLDELRAMVRPNTRLIAINNPNNPTGALMDLELLQEIAAIARGVGAWLLSDEVYRGTDQEGDGFTAAVADIYEKGISTAGMSKAYSLAGLRVGWIAAPAPVIDRLVQVKQGADLHTSTFAQRIAYESAKDGFVERHVDKLCGVYRERRDAMLASLARHLPAGTTWTHPQGGLFLWVELPAGLDSSEVLKLAIEAKVAYVPGAPFHANGGGERTLRLNFSYCPPPVIDEGIRRLGEAVRRAAGG